MILAFGLVSGTQEEVIRRYGFIPDQVLSVSSSSSPLDVFMPFVGSFTAIQIAFTAHIGGFIAGVLITKLLVAVEQNKRIKYLR